MMQGDTALARPANRTRSKQAASTTLSPARQEHTTTGQEDDKSPQSTVEKSSEGAGHAIASTTSHNKRSREEISGVAAAPGPRRRTTRGGAITSTRTTSSSSGNGPVTVKQEAQVSSTPREAVPVVVPIVPVVQAERPSRAAAALAKLAFHSTNIANTGGSSHAGGGNNAAGGQSRASDDINTKKVTYRKCHYVSEAPQRLELVADRHSKGTLLNATIRIKPPDVRMKAFGWSHRGVNFFALALMSAKGERILPELYKDVPLRYRIAALETKMDSKGEETTTEEVLYDEAGQSTVGGLFYFRVPQFKIPGRYSISFQFPREAPSAFHKLDPVSQIVLVVPVDGSGSSISSSSTSSNNNNTNNNTNTNTTNNNNNNNNNNTNTNTNTNTNNTNNNNNNNNNSKKNCNSNQEGAGPRTLDLGDVTRSTEKERILRSQVRPLGGSSAASSLGGGEGVGCAVLVGCSEETGGGVGIKGQQEEFASHVEQSPEFVLTFKDVEQRGRLVSLIIPAGLRLRLAEDWYAVTRKRHLVGNIPRGQSGSSERETGRKQRREQRQLPNVGQVIRGYEKTLSSSSSISSFSSDSKGSKGRMGERLCTLFDGALGNLLLYRFEMNHYLAVLEGLGVSKTPPHQVWGAEHLLRLLAIIPRLLAIQSRRSSKISTDDNKAFEGDGQKGDGGDVMLVGQAEEARIYLQGLLNYLAEHQDTLFAPYEEQPRDFGLDVALSLRPN